MRSEVPTSMAAVQLTGHGGLDMLTYRTDVPVPSPRTGELLVQVAAAGLNNTDVNTRTGWYSRSVSGATGSTDTDAVGSDGSWSGAPLTFPRIQGADVCGRVVAVGEGVDAGRLGDRVVVRTLLTGLDASETGDAFTCWTLGSDCDGGFAQYVVVPASDTWTVRTSLSDLELGAVPCAYGTAENLLQRVGLGAERVLITGASGGVGLAAVHLAKLRGAEVVAVCAAAKASILVDEGADLALTEEELPEAVARGSLDVVVDLVAGPRWPARLELLRRGGRYGTAGAIAGPVAELDLRAVYLRDLTLHGCTFQPDEVFTTLVRHLERGEIRPRVAQTYPLADLASAQSDFMSKKHVGKLVMVPPTDTGGIDVGFTS